MQKMFEIVGTVTDRNILEKVTFTKGFHITEARCRHDPKLGEIVEIGVKWHRIDAVQWQSAFFCPPVGGAGAVEKACLVFLRFGFDPRFIVNSIRKNRDTAGMVPPWLEALNRGEDVAVPTEDRSFVVVRHSSMPNHMQVRSWTDMQKTYPEYGTEPSGKYWSSPLMGYGSYDECEVPLGTTRRQALLRWIKYTIQRLFGDVPSTVAEIAVAEFGVTVTNKDTSALAAEILALQE